MIRLAVWWDLDTPSVEQTFAERREDEEGHDRVIIQPVLLSSAVDSGGQVLTGGICAENL